MARNVVVLLSLAALWVGQAFSTTYRVACRAGLPPFADVVDGECVGIMADLFAMSAHTAGFNYTITPINYVATAAVAVNSTTNQSPFDFGISFNTITPDRILSVDFSLPIGEFGLVAAIHPKYIKTGANLVSSLTETTVLYLLSVKALIIFCSAIIIAFAEIFLCEDSELQKIESYTARIAVCFESTFQVSLNKLFSTCFETLLLRRLGPQVYMHGWSTFRMESPISRTLHCVLEVVQVVGGLSLS
jgi:hypothetical protein